MLLCQSIDFAVYFEIKIFDLSNTVIVGVVVAQDCLSYLGSFESGFYMDYFLYFCKNHSLRGILLNL